MLRPSDRARIAHVVAVAGALTGLGARIAAADPAPEPIRIDYAVPAGCPDRGAFMSAIQARASAVESTAAEARTFAITIAAADDGAPVVGSLAITGDGGTTTTRELAGATCAETVDALALVAALAIEERAAAVVTPPSPPPPRLIPSERSPKPGASRGAWRITAGAGVVRYGGMTPAGVFAVSAFAALGRDRGPRLRLGFSRSERDAITTGAGSADLRATMARVDLCPIALVRGRFDAAPCAGLEVGALSAHGAEVTMATGDTRPWVAPDVALRLRVRSGRFALELEGGLAVPLIRDRFVILPSTTVHRVPAVTTGIGVAITVDLR